MSCGTRRCLLALARSCRRALFTEQKNWTVTVVQRVTPKADRWFFFVATPSIERHSARARQKVSSGIRSARIESAVASTSVLRAGAGRLQDPANIDHEPGRPERSTTISKAGNGKDLPAFFSPPPAGHRLERAWFDGILYARCERYVVGRSMEPKMLML